MFGDDWLKRKKKTKQKHQYLGGDGLAAQSYLTLAAPKDCSPPGSSFLLPGISQARILEWVAISSSRRSSWPRDLRFLACILIQVVC